MKNLERKINNAQVTVEYLLFFAVVVSVLVIFMARGGPYEKGMLEMINSEGNRVLDTGKAMFF